MAVEVLAAVIFTLLLIAFGAMFQFQFFLLNSFGLVGPPPGSKAWQGLGRRVLRARCASEARCLRRADNLTPPPVPSRADLCALLPVPAVHGQPGLPCLKWVAGAADACAGPTPL